jgi:3-methyladenine DNA glycosylase AlkD
METKLANTIIAELKDLAKPEDAIFLQRFFKTGKGEYGEGDKFLGIRNPETRKIAKKYYKTVSNKIIKQLLSSEWHEVRLCALVMMNKIMTYKQTTEKRKLQIYNMYLENISSSINNWDLVDISAPHVVGEYLVDKPERDILKQLADGDLWQKRVSIISTFAFIRENDLEYATLLCQKLMYEEHDLLHKAVGWTMREIGKKDKDILLKMLDENAAYMPRTALRYSLEKLSIEEKKYYMNMKNTAVKH